jgi:hypothetical protein
MSVCSADPTVATLGKTLTRLTVKHAVSLATKENWQWVGVS